MLLLLLRSWLIAPAAFTVKAPVPTFTVPRINALVSVTCTAFAPLFESTTDPVKSLAFASVIAFAPAVKEAVPAPAACVIVVTPLWLIAPAAFTVKAPVPTFTVPRINALVSVTCTAFAPLFERVTAPVKSLAFASVIAFAPVVKEAVPAPAACVIVVTRALAYRTCCTYC